MADRPTITIDGREIEYEPGRTVIQIAHEAGIEVPHYCYHPGLSIAGNCRICLVEVEGMPWPQVSCKLEPRPGMVVRTESPVAKEAQERVMELLLVNHPLDCPICDQAGECHLQDYSYQLGQGESLASTEKTHLPKNVPFGEKVVYDAERCIKCTRCVRFTDEISESHELSMGNRGDQEIVIMTRKGEFDTPYAMNIIDICPVGALTSKDFRFQSRLWFMDFAPSLCTGCARGCNVVMGGRQGRFLRMEPRENPEVNRWWMCDPGRLDYKWVNAPTRLKTPRVRTEDGGWRDLPWEAGLEAAGRALDGVEGDVLVDGNLTLEELRAAHHLAGVLGGKARFAAATGEDGDDLLIVSEKGANARGAEGFGLKRVTEPTPAAVLVVERDRNVPRDLRDGTGARVVITTDETLVPESAQVVLPMGSWAERDGFLVNIDGIVQQIRRLPSVGPQGLLPVYEVLEEIAYERDDSYEPRGRAGLLQEAKRFKAFQDATLEVADAAPTPAPAGGAR